MADANSIPPLKRCSCCGIEKAATTEFFHPNPGGKFGLRGQCRPCRKAAVSEQIKRPDQATKRKAAAAEYVASGSNAARNKLWREKNLMKSRASTAAWKLRNPDRVREAAHRWREENRDKVRAKQRRADARIQQSPIHVLNKRVKSRIRGMLRGKYAPGTIGAHLDFSKAQLVAHIERQFTKGMTWERLMSGEIHIDHIRPVASFNIKEIGDAEFKACWALSNLRPLWNTDNWAKRATIQTLL
jgi:hypothetical protein